MVGKKDKNDTPLTGKDVELWKAMTKDVRRLPGRAYARPEADKPAAAKEGRTRERAVSVPQETGRGKGSAKGKDVDRSTAQKFVRGKMAIEGTLDLHGMSQSDAREALRRFIKSSHARGKRCLLVITGKGAPGRPSVLKARVPEWLDEEPLGPLVLKMAQARRHGGEGAVYVLLRRQRP